MVASAGKTATESPIEAIAMGRAIFGNARIIFSRSFIIIRNINLSIKEAFEFKKSSREGGLNFLAPGVCFWVADAFFIAVEVPRLVLLGTVLASHYLIPESIPELKINGKLSG